MRMSDKDPLTIANYLRRLHHFNPWLEDLWEDMQPTPLLPGSHDREAWQTALHGFSVRRHDLMVEVCKNRSTAVFPRSNKPKDSGIAVYLYKKLVQKIIYEY